MKIKFFIIGLFFLFGAGIVSAVSWNDTANDVVYNATEDTAYYHNFTTNITSPVEGMSFSVDTISTTILWNDNVVNYTQISDWIYFVNTTTGNFTLSATHTNQTGNFTIPIKVTWSGSDAQTTSFNFTITPVNDAPNFTTLNSNYTFSESTTPYNFDINATDEEGEYDGTGYPLSWFVNVTSCDYSDSSSRTDNVSCNDLLLNKSSVGNTTYRLNLTAANDFVGNYTLLLKVNDSNTQTERNLTFIITNINDAPNITFACDNNRDMVEDEIMSCWINATDVDEENNLTFAISSNLAQFTFNDSTTTYNYNCSGVTGQCNASANVTFILNDTAVGNWSVNISVTDTATLNPVGWSNFSFFVNNTEDNVTIEAVNDFTEYAGGSHKFNVTAYDDDLLVSSSQQGTKNELLTFASNNTNLVYFKGTDGNSVSGNQSIRTAYINWTYANESGITNASIKINVTDRLGNSLTEYYSSSETVFLITFDSGNSAPVWNDSATYVFPISEDNSTWGGINLSGKYVSDADGENITFYYTNDSQFDNFNLSNSSGSWLINFTPDDVDVGYHNITLYASDGNVNVTKQFNFTINNIADTPSIPYHYLEADNGNGTTQYLEENYMLLANESKEIIFNLTIDDNDFLIPSGQKDNFYNESLTINVTATNSSSVAVDLFNFSFIRMNPADNSRADYGATFTSSGSQVDNYTIFVNITDNSGISINRTFLLNISAVNDAPNLTLIENQSFTLNDTFNLDINATDEESGNDSLGALSYYLNFTYGTDFVNGNESIFNTTSGIFNLTLNSSYIGEYHINVTVTDGGSNDSQVFYLYVYGVPTITSPSGSYIFNWTEANATGNLEFNISYGVNNTNLTYILYLDNIVYSNSTSFNYTNTTIISSDNLRNSTNWTWVQESNFSWNFTPGYSDETYGKLKNLTLIVYNPDHPELNDSLNWKVNISHTNQNVSFSSLTPIQNKEIYEGSSKTINLSQYFTDVDYWDKNISQTVNFTINHISGNTTLVSTFSSVDNSWILTLTISSFDISSSITETISLTAFEWNTSSISIGNATSGNFNVTFDPATTTTTTTPVPTSGGGKTKLKHFSLKLILPQDVIISDLNYIDIPFTIQNNGQVDLVGINLASYVRFNDEFSDDVKISLGDSYIKKLKIRQSENFTMRILANTQKAGRYKATIFANVTSPKFSDWGEFFIELKKTNETEAEQKLMFVEKFIAENPNCLELTELVNEAKKAFDLGEYSNSIMLARKATEACERMISSNEQIKYPITGFVRDNFYYISFSTLAIFLLGFIFYVYKRVRFNKYKVDEYI